MKNKHHLLIHTLSVICFFFITGKSYPNWIKNQNANSLVKEVNYSGTGESLTNKNDSLPAGFTNDMLKELRDEKGNKIYERIQTSDPGDEGDAMQQRVFNGFNTGDKFGTSVASAGDVNGDGFDDIIIGATDFDDFAANIGRVYIYHGGLNINTEPDIILTGENVSFLFGSSVSTAGDVNGDGYDDVVIGAPGASSNSGKAYIYFGGIAMNNVADVVLPQSNSYFAGGGGKSVSTAGDFNGDGYSDVIVGEYRYASFSDQGRAFIYYGGAVMDNTPDVTFTGEAVNNYFGYSVCSAGNVNGDEYDDIIIGAFRNGNNYTGKAYIFFGNGNDDNTADVTFTGLEVQNNFGASVSTAGDVNGDGFSDVIIGAYGYNNSRGRAEIYFGGESMDNVADVFMNGEVTGINSAIQVSGLGDVNGDGYSDVVVGSDFGNNTGRANIFYGGLQMDNVADQVLNGENTSDYFGEAATSAGDVNGDGYSDIIIGAKGYGSNKGRAYLYTNTMSGDDIADLSFTGQSSINFGVSVSTAGDVNGDGYSDIIVGATEGFGANSKAFIFYGGLIMDNSADVTLNGPVSGFGYSVSTAGDVNADGYSDVIVGSTGAALGNAFIYYGGVSMNTGIDITLYTGISYDQFGQSVSDAGDIDGDGYAEVIIGAPGHSSNTGRAYIYSAHVGYIAVLQGESSDHNFGISISGAGDVNGDGYSDVIVGEKYPFTGPQNGVHGRAFIFYGGNGMDVSADVTMTGEGDNNTFGQSVSDAGDVNGDGYSDVIVGEFQIRTPGSAGYYGRAFIFNGGAVMDNYPDATMNGIGYNNDFGISVSGAGDVNNDGYSDVIVGQKYSDNINKGKAFIYFGSVGSYISPNITMTDGDFFGDFFGNSVSSAGDVNADGLSDVVAGDNFGAGKTLLFRSSAPAVNPNFIYVKDVPNDQGGKVHLKWARSGYDTPGFAVVIDYFIQRSYPPIGGNFSWETIFAIPATNEPFYTYTANTPYDLSSGTSGVFYYRISARSSIANKYWRSEILSGHSIDNIAPDAVNSPVAMSVSNNVVLSWEKNLAPDLLNYIIYRSYNDSIDPGTETPFAHSTDSTFTDSLPGGDYNYFIAAQDIHNNKSPVTKASRQESIILNLKMYMEGFYNNVSNQQISDTISVSLRSNITPYNIIDASTSVVSSTGDAVFAFDNAPDGSYYVTITHRNALETWSSSSITLTTGSSFNYDFSNQSSKAYGNNIKQIDNSPVRFGIFSGNVNQDQSIDLTDILLTYNDAATFVTGYKSTDANGDNVTDLIDIIITYNNSANFVAVIKP